MAQTDPADSADRLEDLFQLACDLDPSARASFLDAECAGDARLRRALEQLLAASAAADSNEGWEQPALLNEARCSSTLAEAAVSIDRYQLQERIGAGGMGVVYKAVRADDYSKVVAIKIVDRDARGNLLHRFRTERQILAGLEHPNIARLLDGGSTAAGAPFLVMEFVDGVAIDRHVRDKGLSTREILALFRKICSTVSCAHSHLVVHRDLKPANVLVTDAGEPKLLDFGIAKLMDGAAERTLTARAMTPDYASPEQIRGEAVGIATDVYALGVLLYQLLSGRLPYGETSNPIERARAICEAPPRPFPAVDSELETIVRMALRKEPGRRYASVEQFSDDIRRYLESYPVRARRDTRAYRARKFVKRNRFAVLTAAAIVATLIGGIVSTTVERDRAESAEARGRRSLYAAQMSLAFQAWETANVARALDLLETQRPRPGQEDLRGFEWRLLWQLTHVASRVLSRPPELIRSVAFSPDGRSVVAATDAGKARIWNVQSGALERSADFDWPCNVVFSPDGRLLAGASDHGSVALRRVDTGETVATFRGDGSPMRAVAFSPDGQTVAGGTIGGVLVIDRVNAAGPPLVVKAHPASITSVTFSPDGRTLATTSKDHAAKVWDLTTGRAIGTLVGHSWWVLTAAFSPDGTVLATSGSDGEVKFWGVSERHEIASIRGDGTTINYVSFSPDGKLLSAVGEDSVLRIFDVASRRLISTFRGHTDGIKSVEFSRDGKTLVTGGFDRTVRLWDLDKQSATLILDGHQDWVWDLRFSPDGRTLATASKDGTVKLWDYREGRELASLKHPQWVNGVAFSPDGRWLATADDDGLARIWNSATREVAATLAGHTDVVESVSFSPDGRTLASAAKNGEVRLWDAVTRLPIAVLKPSGRNMIWSVAFSPDGKQLAAAAGEVQDVQAGGDEYPVTLWDVSTRRIAAVLRGHTRDVRSIAFSPAGDLLASGSYDRTIKLWNMKTGRQIATLASDRVLSIVFSPDGKRLAAAGQDKTVKLWDVATLEEVASLSVPSQINAVAFSPDDLALAVASNDGKVRLWMAARKREVGGFSGGKP